LLLLEWGDLVIALNSLNRSMGMPDPYPFAITDAVRAKLELVHRLIRERPTVVDAAAATASVATSATASVPAAPVAAPAAPTAKTPPTTRAEAPETPAGR
jgi:hypothetical protein